MSQYKDETNSNVNIRCAEMLEEMPEFCGAYLISMSGYTKPLTQLAYLQRIDFFFRWLHEYNAYFEKRDIRSFSINDLALLRKSDFEDFLHHIETYGALSKIEIYELRKANKFIPSSKASTRNNYLSAINSLFNYFVDEEYLPGNPLSRIRHKKEDKKIVIALDDSQKDQVMSVIDYGSQFLSDRQNAYLEIVRTRDHAIVLLAMRTGIRVSELVGIDVEDVDFKRNRFMVTRKRGKEEQPCKKGKRLIF